MNLDFLFFFSVQIQAETINILFVCHLEGRKVKYILPENYFAFPLWGT